MRSKSSEFQLKKKTFTPKLKEKFNKSKHKTIQELINTIPAYTLLKIPSGSYQEDIVINKPIHIKGDGNVIFKSTGDNNAFTINSEHAILENIIIQQGNTKFGGGINLVGGYLVINHCKVSSECISAIVIANDAHIDIVNSIVSKSENPSLMISNDATASLYNSEFSDSKTSGISLYNKSECKITNCKIHGNEISGIFVENNSSLIVEKSEIMNNNHYGITIYSINQIKINNCNIHDNKEIGIIVKGKSTTTLTNSILRNNSLKSVFLKEEANFFSKNNKYIDSLENCMIHSMEKSICNMNQDTIEGKCIFGLAASENGVIECNDVSIVNIVGSGITCFKNGILKLNNTKLKNIEKLGIQVNEGTIEANNIQVCFTKQTGIIIANSSSEGFIKNSGFLNSNECGMECTNVQNFLIENCDFNENQTRGAVFIEGSDVTLVQCNFMENKYGVQIQDQSKNQFIKCKLNTNSFVGADILDNSQPKFTECTFINNGEAGLSSEGGNPILEKCEFSGNKIAALIFDEGSQSTLTECNIHDGGNIGIQARSKNTKIDIIGSKILDHTKSLSIMCLEEATINCIGCEFNNSLKSHCESRDNGKILLNECILGKTLLGICVQVHHGGELFMENSSISDQGKVGIFVFDGGHVNAKLSKISKCGGLGVFCHVGSDSVFENCEFFDNEQAAIQVMGNVQLRNCIIKNNQRGIIIGEKWGN